MSSVKIEGNASGTGVFTIASPNGNTNRTLTLPDNTGTIVTTGSTTAITQSMIGTGVAGTGPAFAATRITSDQTGTQNTYVKVQFQNELFDTASCYDSTTNYRFTPNVAGYYLFNTSIQNNPSAGSQTQLVTRFYKNGSSTSAYSNLVNGDGIGGGTTMLLTELIYMNGTTDYVEVFQYSSATTPTYQQGSYFSGCLVRAA